MEKRKSFEAFYKSANTYLIIVGIGLFLYQLLEYYRAS